MIIKSYCVNIAVTDLERATKTYEEILGHDAIPMKQVPGAGSKARGVEFPVGGLYSLGLVTTEETPSPTSSDLVARHLGIRGEGAHLVGLLVDDIDEQAAALAQHGTPTTTTAPVDVGVGRSIFTDPEQTAGTVLQFTQLNDPEGTERLWSERARSATRRRAYQAYVLDIAVNDLDTAAGTYANAFGIESIPMPDGADPSESMDATHFTVGAPADNVVGGLYAIGLMTPRGAPRGPIPQAVNDYLDAHGDGSFLVAFLTRSLEEQIDHLQSLDIKLCYEEPMRYVHGRLQMTEPIHGVWLDFAEHDHDAFDRWQTGE
jgi:predicted enzyme related to lactoylglutathione lyase